MASNVTIHKKMLSQILDYEHNQIQVHFFLFAQQSSASSLEIIINCTILIAERDL